MRNFLWRGLFAGILAVAACLPGLASLLPFPDALNATGAITRCPVRTSDELIRSEILLVFANWAAAPLIS